MTDTQPFHKRYIYKANFDHRFINGSCPILIRFPNDSTPIQFCSLPFQSKEKTTVTRTTLYQLETIIDSIETVLNGHTKSLAI